MLFCVFRVVGDTQTLLVKFGKDVGDGASEDVVLVRGVRTEVDRVVEEIHKIVEDAKEDERLSGFVSISGIYYLSNVGALYSSYVGVVRRV